MKKTLGLALIAGLISQMSVAQEKNPTGFNPLSVRPVHESNVMYKLSLWRRIDLNEKMNQPFFSKGAEITRHLIDAVKAGLLEAYTNDSLTTKMTLEQFNKNLAMENSGGGLSEEEKKAGLTESTDDGWGNSTTPASTPAAGGNAPAPVASASSGIEYFPTQLTLLEIKEDWIFDKQRSRQYNDILTLTMFIPASQTQIGFDKPVATFKYKDLERYFRSNPKCIWYNEANIAQHKNLADAFELRLFHGKIVRKSDARGRYLDDIYKSPREGLLKSQQLEYELMEKEHNLWEY